ncbi:MAG: lamin tail domain-containing protein [Caldilineaceae bacterium]|nr:lamin tail domain-containing protein [Caldilineaceae bacterium]
MTSVLWVPSFAKYTGRRATSLLIAASLLASLWIFAASSVYARPLAEEDTLPPTHVIADHVVISEVRHDGTGSNEFVELYNPTDTPVVMSGWRLRRKNSAGTEENLVVTLNGTIPAYGYFLIGHGTGYTGTVALDVAYSAPSNALTNNFTVLLYSDAGVTLVDKVGYGTAADFEGSQAPNPSATASIERKAFYFSTAVDMGAGHATLGNGYDSNNNSNDFVLRTTPNPQNSSSLPEPCCTTITGALKRQGRTDHSGIEVVMWPGTGLRATTASSGQFSIPNAPAIASGETPTYTLEVSVPGYLTPRATLDLRDHLVGGYLPPSVTFPELWLYAGDINGDNRINIFDLARVGSHYGYEGVSPADVNGDGKVNIQDLALVSGNFGRESIYVWEP